MKINYNKAYSAIQYGGKLPRKTKKSIIGIKANKTELKNMLKNVRIEGEDIHGPQILPFPFCPQCGCTTVRSINHFVEYPERWIDIFCARCGFMVERSDNSRFIHCLELPEYNYKLI